MALELHRGFIARLSSALVEQLAVVPGDGGTGDRLPQLSRQLRLEVVGQPEEPGIGVLHG
ncbi:Uncharacterised protein [Mycobacteroides abscessus]|nr:Uncharacterised protein [Mycobacteroides abscessus]